ncbi:MAG TPA: phospholipid carrier-dependent glycosyltransferase, partial [Thermoanaerobaculia bacterium]
RTVTLRLDFAGRLERGAVSTILGLALAAHLLLLLGFAGLLRPLPVLLLAAAIHVAGWTVWREVLTELRGISVPGWLGPALLLGLAPFVLLALYPPTAFDATLYHLPFARAFAETGGVPYLVDRRFPVFPQANEILFAAVMLFGRDVAAQGVQLFATLLTALLLAAWGKRALPSRELAGWLAAAVFLGNPIVVYLAGNAYIEPGLALFVAASLYALDRWRETDARGWLALSALFGATAADVKYLGLYFLGIAALTVLFAGGRFRSAPARLRDGLLFAAVAVSFLLPWYLRIYLHTGNPIFPYLIRVFGGSYWQSLPRSGVPEALPERLARWVRLPWDVIFARARYNQEPPISPVYLAALPLLAFGALRDGRVRWLLGIAAVYSFIFIWLPADSRYLVPLLPLASLAIAGSLAMARLRLSRTVHALLCVACLLPGWLYAGYRIGLQGRPPITTAARDAYLARRLPLYPAIAWLNRTRGSGYSLYALHAENMTYFAAGRFVGDWVGPGSFGRVLGGTRDTATLRSKLRALSITHLLIPESLRLPFPEAELRRDFQLVYRDADARLYALRAASAARGFPGRTSAISSRR